MADILEIPPKYRRRMSQEVAMWKAYHKLYNQRWILVCQLFYLYRNGK